MKPYRSELLLPGMLNVPGKAHIHLDTSSINERLIMEIMKRLELSGHPGKLNIVNSFIAGSQRKLLPEIYESHTPVIEDKEALDFFSSNLVKDRVGAVGVINLINEMLGDAKGIIIEMEQVLGWISPDRIDFILGDQYMSCIEAHEVALPPSPTLAYELHHGFDIKGAEPSVSLDKLSDFCDSNEIEFGGWFIFPKPTGWAYRSNAFTDGVIENPLTTVRREQKALAKFLEQEKVNAMPRAIIEKVVGIWHH